MGLFTSKDNSYLGVDIGSHNIKLVELENQKGRPKLATYGFTDHLGGEEPDLLDDPDRVVGELKLIMEKARVKSRRVIAALPVSLIFSSIINLANLKTDNTKELEEAIKSQAKKVIPLSLDEMILYHNELKTETEKLNGNLPVRRFLLTAAPKELVKKYLDIFKKANLQILSLETESFALARSLVGNDKSAVMVVDLGEADTNITVIKNGIPILNRSVDVAGRHFTKILNDSLKLDFAAAERFKRDLSDLNSEEFLNLRELLDNLVHEINYCFGLYQQENVKVEENIEKIILTGGTSLLVGLDKYLANKLSIRVFVGDPWSRIVYPEELKPVLDKIGPRLSVAAGLAMREII